MWRRTLIYVLIFCLSPANLFPVTAPLSAAPPLLRLPPEQTTIRRLDPEQLTPAPITPTTPPRTVLQPADKPTIVPVRLNEILRETIEETEVVRVLTGITATSTGQTIYDPAIVNTTIDSAQGAFDPVLTARQDFLQNERPLAALDPILPGAVRFDGRQVETSQTLMQLSKRNLIGGQATARWENLQTDPNLPVPVLDPFNDYFWEVGYVQPLLRGGGLAVNVTPIVLARINTDRSYFQFKDSLQELVASTITGYWNLMSAHVDRWAREQQVMRAAEAARLAAAQSRTGIASDADRAQTEAGLANFRANLVAAQANLLDRDAALRNVLGLPPDGQTLLDPVTAPVKERLTFNWDQLLAAAEAQRPDIIELKLILAADRQVLAQNDNLAQPQLDSVALYRWNGLEGEIPANSRIRTDSGQYTDWQLGVNFSVPLGLRTARANLRQQELIIARDQANLDQGIHQMLHNLALNIRKIDQLYAQYEAYRTARQASLVNLELQEARLRLGINPNTAGQVVVSNATYLNFLQAVESWGNNVSAEAQALANYNIALAELERATGTILEIHGIRMMEERYGSISPWGRHAAPRCYPKALTPTEPSERYSNEETTSEKFFDLSAPRDIQALPDVNELPDPDSTLNPPLTPDADTILRPAEPDSPLDGRGESNGGYQATPPLPQPDSPVPPPLPGR